MMLDHSDLISEGVGLFSRLAPDIKNYIIGIEKNKPECIKEMNRVFQDNNAVSVKALPMLYPQGAEKVLIRNTTGLTVPEGKLPKDIGVLVINVTTLATLANFAKTGMPLVERCVTVDGSAIKEPKNVIVPIGTSIGDVIAFAGGFSQDPGKVILGGPMTGNTVYSLDEPVVKTTGAVLALSLDDSKELEPSACIHCGKCVDACPHLLNPTAFNKAMTIENTEEKMATLEELSVHMCMECGCCSYVCPANRPLSETNKIAKNALKEYKAYKASLK
jgi:electron transport complex protein RnfC